MKWTDQPLFSLAVRNQWKVQMVLDGKNRAKQPNDYDLFHARFSVSSAKNKEALNRFRGEKQ